MRLIGADGDVAVNAEIYLRLSAPGIPALLLALAGTGYIRGLQDTRTPLLVAVGTSVLNLVLEVLFVYGLDLGIGASAVATVIAQWTGAVVFLAVIAPSVRRHGVALRPDRRSLARLGRAGRDLMIRTAALRGALMLAVVVATHIGDVDLGAFQVAFQIWNLLALVLDAIAIAGQSMVAKSLGAGDAGAARAMARRMIEWSVVSGLVLAGLVVALRTVVPELFSDDPAVIALAAFMLWHIAALQPAAAVVFALDGILIGAGDYRFLARAMVVAFGAFGAASLAVVALDLGRRLADGDPVDTDAWRGSSRSPSASARTAGSSRADSPHLVRASFPAGETCCEVGCESVGERHIGIVDGMTTDAAVSPLLPTPRRSLSARLDREWAQLVRRPEVLARVRSWDLTDRPFASLDELLTLAGYTRRRPRRPTNCSPGSSRSPPTTRWRSASCSNGSSPACSRSSVRSSGETRSIDAFDLDRR